MRATVVELFNNCWNKSTQCWMQRRHLWPPKLSVPPAPACHHSLLPRHCFGAKTLRHGTGECSWGRRDPSFPPRDATYHQPGPQETTPVIGPGTQISGAAPPAGSCFAPVLHQILASSASKLSRRWRRAALAAPQLLSSRLSRATWPRATVAMGKTPPPTSSPLGGD